MAPGRNWILVWCHINAGARTRRMLQCVLPLVACQVLLTSANLTTMVEEILLLGNTWSRSSRASSWAGMGGCLVRLGCVWFGSRAQPCNCSRDTGSAAFVVVSMEMHILWYCGVCWCVPTHTSAQGERTGQRTARTKDQATAIVGLSNGGCSGMLAGGKVREAGVA